MGRTKEARDFVNRVKQHRLVVLSGESGVGKSSLLNARLVPELAKVGFTPLVCREWPSKTPSQSINDYGSTHKPPLMTSRLALARFSSNSTQRFTDAPSLFWIS